MERSAKYGDARKKLYEALNVLVVGNEKIQMRLTYAGSHLLTLQPHADFPPEMSHRFVTIKQELTGPPLSNDRGYVPRPITDKRGDELAMEILSLYTDVMGGL